MTERPGIAVEQAPRAGRLTAAAAATVLAPAAGLLVVTTGRGLLLEDACITEPAATWAPELTAVRGPLSEGLTTFRCEQVTSPGAAFVFTDVRPLALTVVVGAVVVVLVALLWARAVRRPEAAVDRR